MEDLSGLDWSAPAKTQEAPKLSPGANYTSFYSSFNNTSSASQSGRSTPLDAQKSGSQNGTAPSSKPPTSGNDSFSNLVSFGGSKSTQNQSLQERQKSLLEEKKRQADQQRSQFDAQYGPQDSQFWETLGTKQSTNGQPSPTQESAQEEDILAAFSSAAPVDRASHFPPPSVPPQATRSNGHSKPNGSVDRRDGPSSAGGTSLEDDDDPFGLGSGKAQSNTFTKPATTTRDDDDVLGLLGKPVEDATARRKQRSPSPTAPKPPERRPRRDDPRDRPVAELVDMGFPADKAREALAHTDTGTDIQAAVSWLLNEAHRKAREKTGNSDGTDRVSSGEGQRSSRPQAKRNDSSREDGVPAWMKPSSRSQSGQRRTDGASGAEKDISQFASEVGNNLFKSANSLWSTGRKKVQKAVNELQQEGDPNQPRWMRSAQSDEPTHRSNSRHGQRDRTEPSEPANRSAKQNAIQDFTPEAQLLDAPAPEPSKPRKSPRPVEEDSSRRGSPFQSDEPPRGRAGDASNRPPAWADSGIKSRVSKAAVEEQSSQAYVSPARRRKQAASTAKPSEPDLFGNDSLNEKPGTKPSTQHSQSTTSLPSRSKASMRPPSPPRPSRKTPSVSPSSLASSASARQKGLEAWKLGDYAAAQAAYTQSLSPIPAEHPIAIVILCNRALVNLKVGDTKAAIADSETALSIIGPSQGRGERITLEDEKGSGPKDMRSFYGKALMRKAEALEQLEKHAEASRLWTEVIEAGVGDSSSIQARRRCENAAGIAPAAPPASSTKAKRPPPTAKKPPARASALDDLRPGSAPPLTSPAKPSAISVAEAKVTAERAALADLVADRITAWKEGKQDNLRALLSSVDAILWPELGWKKVGMHELVLPAKVKIAYMKALAKVHPDKLPTNATTEQRMIIEHVFSTLNSAWTKFKAENGL